MDTSGIGLSGVNAFETKLNVTANNIANQNTAQFKPSEANTQDNAGQGVYVTISQSSTPGVDLAKEMVDMMTSKIGIEANLKSIEAADETTQHTLDIIA